METEKGQITRIYNGEIITPERNFGVGTVLIAEGKIIGIEPGNYEVPGSIGHDAHGGYIAPGFIDLHVHLREPGFAHKETVRTGTQAKKTASPLPANTCGTELPYFILPHWLRIIRNCFASSIYTTG